MVDMVTTSRTPRSSLIFPSYPGSLGTSAGEPLATISWFWDSIAARDARLLVVVVVARVSRARGVSDGAWRVRSRLEQEWVLPSVVVENDVVARTGSSSSVLATS